MSMALGAFIGGLLLLKAALLWILCRLTGRSHSESVQVAVLLAQAGEFGFILFGLANMLGVMDQELHQLLLLVIALSMVATPLIVRLSPWLGRTLASTSPAVTPRASRSPLCETTSSSPASAGTGIIWPASWRRRVFLAISLEADLVVLGTMARSGITGFIVESTAVAIIKSLYCSVLVVKPPGFVTSVVVEE
jgi:hypothetical protein